MMCDAIDGRPTLGYCTNVHAGTTLEQTLANLETHALAVKASVSPDAPMGVGLWLSASVARELIDTQQIELLRKFLDVHGLVAHTLNGFPFGDFHQRVVKHDVYQPDWRQQARFDYTLDLVHILSQLLPDGMTGSISTLPLGWPSLMRDDGDIETAKRNAAARLLDLVHQLARVELDTGKLIHVDLEPEPGCLLSTSTDVVDFFNRYLLDNPDERSVREYLRICHDVCHAAVMFEDQGEALRRYTQAGLKVGKVQVSSAVRVDFDAMDETTREQAMHELRGFAEDRYLHQTAVRSDDGQVRFYDDLGEAMKREGGKDQDVHGVTPWASPGGEWRVHFHVPIYLDEIGTLGTTRGAIERCLPVARAMGVQHFEAETYAWGVLPTALRVERLADGIAKELSWLSKRMTSRT
ncbi:metabolite traffic protein EboE [Phycisphaerales bacterium AB-hyl4]|uniref:Metabolite traffic protein EboE n=1 Tax=Natronomicrosphaera hydrolytica TaxID=3242702 RepID=A0ABV4U1R7_9BACT